MIKNIYVVAAKRTAFGKYGGKLANWNATDLQVAANKAAIAQSGLSADKIDSSIVGNIIHVNLRNASVCFQFKSNKTKRNINL
jgi:acetyl-CoA acyltransferase 2